MLNRMKWQSIFEIMPLCNIMIWEKTTVFSRLQILFLPRLNMPQKRRRASLKN